MADQEEEELRMALRMSMQNESPEPKRSKPRENAGGGPAGDPEESPEVKSRKVQRELMAAAAERRMMAVQSAEKRVAPAKEERGVGGRTEGQKCVADSVGENMNLGKELSVAEANQLFLMVFGSEVTRDILAQWSNQGVRYV